MNPEIAKVQSKQLVAIIEDVRQALKEMGVIEIPWYKRIWLMIKFKITGKM